MRGIIAEWRQGYPKALLAMQGVHVIDDAGALSVSEKGRCTEAVRPGLELHPERAKYCFAAIYGVSDTSTPERKRPVGPLEELPA